MGTCGIAAGAEEVRAALEAALSEHGAQADLVATGCSGMCYREVLVEVAEPDGSWTIYGDVTPEGAARIVEQHLAGGQKVDDLVVRSSWGSHAEDSFFAKQEHVALRHCGLIDPEKIEDYVALGGYEALRRALEDLSPEQLIDLVTESGIRGRGGAGFPTGRKWGFARAAQADQKYVICNADEGDPGAFMDRSVLEGDPHAVVEGMALAGYAIGASRGVIYVRAEYPLAIRRLRAAIDDARAAGYLGRNIQGSSFDFDIDIKEGAGAFVCGEETALMASVEGRRGMPRPRPPYPAVSGLWAKPTVINNVETLANIAWIVANGPESYAGFGTEGSKGTKVFALTGKVVRGGLAEVPMGLTLREVIYDIGGGIQGGREFKAVQMGGPSGGCLPAELLETPIDYESLKATGAIVGSGGMVVMDETSCMVEVARYFMDFTQDESCGQCSPCRLGLHQLHEILTRITEGQGQEEDMELLRRLASDIKDTSLCALGGTAPNPVLTTLRHFPDEYEAHIKEHRCPAGVCKALIEFAVEPELCPGCGACAKVCPAGAVSGEKKQPYVIDLELCTKCGRCREVCRFEAVRTLSPPSRWLTPV